VKTSWRAGSQDLCQQWCLNLFWLVVALDPAHLPLVGRLGARFCPFMVLGEIVSAAGAAVWAGTVPPAPGQHRWLLAAPAPGWFCAIPALAELPILEHTAWLEQLPLPVATRRERDRLAALEKRLLCPLSISARWGG